MISFDQDETSPTGREYPHCLTLPLAASTHYPSSIISFELIYHDIRDLLLSYSDDILIQQKFLTLLHLLPVEEKTTPFYCSLLPPILMNPHFSFEILEILLNYDPNILEHQDQYGNTVFHYLCMSSIDLQIIQYFFAKSSIPLKLVNQCGETCLHVAVQSRNIDLRLVELLIFYYPDAINISSRAGKLPIHYLFRASSPDDYDETARQKCLDILLKHNPTSAYVDVTEKITRINILSILPPSVEAIPQPAIQQIERKWSPYSEAYRKFVDQNDQTDLQKIKKWTTCCMISNIRDKKYHRNFQFQDRERCTFQSLHSCHDGTNLPSIAVEAITDISPLLVADTEANL